jgi:hypothetical protein
MNKLAQERGILNKLREEINLSGKALERINPEFEEVMNRLRSTDGRIRGYAEDLKSSVRNANSLYRRRDYLAAAKNIAGFHERCRYIAAELNKFSKSINMKHYQFLLDQFDDEQKQELFGYDPSKEISLDDESSVNDMPAVIASLQKSAGPVDWYHKVRDPIADLAHNLTSERGRAMRAFEKRFSIGFLKSLKTNTERMVQATIRFLSFLLSKFKRLSSALATRNVGDYKKNADEFVEKFARFDAIFKDYHVKHIVPLKEQYAVMQQAAAVAAQKVEEEKSRQLEEAAAKERSQGQNVTMPGGVPLQSGPPASSATNPVLPVPSQKEQGKVLDKLEEKPFSSHQDFIERIELLAYKNDPKVLVNEILKYSAKIEDENIEDSLKLLAIAEGIIEKAAAEWDAWEKPQDQPKPKPEPKVTKPRVKKVEHKVVQPQVEQKAPEKLPFR